MFPSVDIRTRVGAGLLANMDSVRGQAGGYEIAGLVRGQARSYAIVDYVEIIKSVHRHVA